MIFVIIGDPKLTESEKCKAIELAALKNPESLTKVWLGMTPLHYAVMNRLPIVIKLLLKLGCPIDAEDTDQQTPLHHAAENGMDEAIFMLGYHNCNFNKVDKKNESALHKAIKNNHPICVENLLLASQFTIQKTLVNKEGQTAEDILRKCTNIKSQVALAKAFSTTPDLFLRTPLHLAVINNDPDLVQLHLGLGALINEQDGDGRTALHLAAFCGHAPIMLLLSYHDEVNLDQVDKNGNTALHLSIESGSPNCVKILVSAKKPADKYIKNNEHLTALDLIEKWKNKEVITSLEKALMSTQLRNGLSDQYEKEVFTFDQPIHTDYMHYLKNNFKELEPSVKGLLDEKVSPRVGSEGSSFKRFGMSLSPRRQSIGDFKNSHEKSSLSSSSEQDSSIGEDDIVFPRRRKISSPRERLTLFSSEPTNSDKEINGDTLLPIRRKKSSPRTKNFRDQLNLAPEISNNKLSREPTGEDNSFPKVKISNSPQEKSVRVKLNLSKLLIVDKERTGDDKLFDEVYYNNDINAAVNIIKNAQKHDSLLQLKQQLQKFIETYSNERASSFFLSVFNELKPAMIFEQDNFDKKCAIIRKMLHKKLLFEGLKHICSHKEINKLTRKEFSIISDQEETIKHLEVLTEICSGSADRNTYIIDLNSTIIKCLGLMDFIEPHEIISMLIKLNPLFSNIQRLQSHYIIFTFIELHDFYGYDCMDGLFAEKINLYTQSCCETRVSQMINEYKLTINAFKTNSFHAVVKQFRPALINAMELKKEDIIDKVNEFVNQGMSSLKHKSALILLDFITREFNFINAKFYQNCMLKEFRHKCWEPESKDNSHSSLLEYTNRISEMITFIQNTIRSYDSPQKQAQAIILFILVARESLHYQYGPDLITLTAINIALFSCEVSSLKAAFALLDKNSLKILDSLFKLAGPDKNYRAYRDLIVADQRSLPFPGVMFGDKIHLYEHSLHDNLTFLGNVYQPLIVIKKNLCGIFLDSRSNLLDRLDAKKPKENIEINSTSEKNSKLKLQLEHSTSKNKGLSLFNNSNLEISSSRDSQNAHNKTDNDSLSEPPNGPYIKNNLS